MTIKENGKEKINYYNARRKSQEFRELLGRYLSFIQFPCGTSEYCVLDEVLDAEIETVRNCLLWDYEFQRINADSCDSIPTAFETVMYKFLKFVRSNISDDKKIKQSFELKDKCFFSNPRVGERIHRMLSVVFDFLEPMNGDYNYAYFQNLEIGDATGGGNHRMFAQTIRNEDVCAYVEVCDDLDFLKNFRTDGVCIYEVANPENYLYIGSDERIGLLFILMQIKAGLIPVDSLDEYVLAFCNPDIPYPTERYSNAPEKKPSLLCNLKFCFLMSWHNAVEAFCETWKESRGI